MVVHETIKLPLILHGRFYQGLTFFLLTNFNALSEGDNGQAMSSGCDLPSQSSSPERISLYWGREGTEHLTILALQRHAHLVLLTAPICLKYCCFFHSEHLRSKKA